MKDRVRIFEDRRAAGVLLGRALQRRSLKPPLLVLGLPRGGVPVAHEVALLLGAPLDVLPVRKVGMPGQPELAIGAIAWGDVAVREPRLLAQMPELAAAFAGLAAQQRGELVRRERLYRRGLGPLVLEGRTVVLVDDGLATGCTMQAAVRAARKAGAAAIIVAAPVASPEAAHLLAAEADDLVVLESPGLLSSIGEWYEHFEQLEDAEVLRLLDAHRRRAPGAA